MSVRPAEITLHQTSRQLEVAFEDGARFQLPCEYLRVFSPSAEVRGHSPDTATLVTGKETVNINAIEPVGHYAVRLVFDDGHASGLYSWETLYQLGIEQEHNWQSYLSRLAEVGYQRQGDVF